MLQLFETFCAVAETGSISKAAEALHISQPAVTRQVKALEQELGAVLLTRTPQGVLLTPVGRRVLVHAKQAIAAVAACRRSVEETTSGSCNHLAIAAGSMVTQYIVSPVLAAYKKEHPDLHVDLYTGHYQDCLNRLIAYEVDLALISTPLIPPGLKARSLLVDPVVLVTAPDSPLSETEDVSLADVEGLTLLVLPRAAGLRQQLTKVLADAGVEAHLVEHSTVETIKTMVGLDIGVSLLPRSAVAEEVAQGKLAAVPVRDWPDHGRSVLVVTRSEGALPEPAAGFLKALRERYGSESKS